MERNALMRQVTREAGALLAEHFGKKLEIRKKGNLDLVTQADEAAERLILNGIINAFPDDSILAEEGGARQGNSGYQWIIDPLDGTTNFAHSLPQFAVSIALCKEEQIIAGMVYNPIREELFEAALGEGAFLNGNPISVAQREDLNEALAVTGFSYDRRQRMDELLERVRCILMNCQGFRRLGSAALDLAFIACGRYDVFLEDGLNAWDMAAGALIVSEAGGVISHLDGSPFKVHSGQILATNQHLQAAALAHLR